MSTPSHPIRIGQSVPNFLQTHHISSRLLLFCINLTSHIALIITFAFLLEIAISFSLGHKVSLQNHRLYSTLINPFFHFPRNLSSIQQLATFCRFYPFISCSCCHRCFSSSAAIQSVPQATTLANSTRSKNGNYSSGATIPFNASTHASQTTAFSRIAVRFFIFAHSPRTPFTKFCASC